MNISTDNNKVSSDCDTENSKCLEEEKTEFPKGTVIEENMSPENSDYDSADSYSDSEQQAKIRSRASDEQSHSDAESIILERQEGDGQESIPTKKVDDDEDKKNPQYIPKKGTFYEHDDRTVDDEENENEVEKDKDNKKKVWQDKKEKWTHDKFNDQEQAPKSRAELISIYGYDIRNEEGPPRARRRRRYGRGPNKYTRTWEDEAAYVKAAPTKIRTKKQREPDSNSSEEFPPLVKSSESKELSDNITDENQRPSDNNSINEKRSIENKSYDDNNKRKDQINNWKSQERTDSPRENYTDNGVSATQNLVNNKNYQNTSTSNDIKDNNKNAAQRTNSGRVVKPRNDMKESDHHGFTTKTLTSFRLTKVKKQKVLPPKKQQPKEEHPDRLQSSEPNSGSNTVQELETNINKLSINGGHKTNKTQNSQNTQQRQTSVPPRLQNEQKGSKRYSSMRQRSLPEANTPPAMQAYSHSGYYSNEYNQQSENTGVPQPLIHQTASIHHTTPQVTQIPPQAIPIPPQVTPVTAAPILQAPFPQGFPPAPPAAFLQPQVTPASYIPPPSAQIINYVQGQPTFTTPNYQGYQQQFNPVHELLYSSATDFSPPITTEQLQTPQTELYQPHGGITYYSTDQQVTQRSVPQKRPKVAIPIVAPPSANKKDFAFEQQTIEDRNEVNESTDGHQ